MVEILKNIRRVKFKKSLQPLLMQKKAKNVLVFQPYNIFGEGYMMIFVKETNSVERRKSN